MPIDQLVIVMLENRSFDHLLGYFSLDEYRGRRASRVNGLTTASLKAGMHDNGCIEGGVRRPFPIAKDGALARDLPHSRTGIAAQLAWDPALQRPTMRGFVRAEYPQGATPARPASLGYYTPACLPVTDFLATEYMVCDQWFCPIPTDTHPNRLMAVAGYSNLDATGSLTRQKTVLDFVTDAGGEIEIFAKRMSFLGIIYDHAVDAIRRTNRFRPFEAFDAAWRTAPTGPKVWVVEPGYSDVPMIPGLGFTDEPPDCSHPPHPVCRAERFLEQVYRTVAGYEDRWQRTLMIVTYDEHGGFYDHEIPPQLVTNPPATVSYKPFPGLGPRVPALLVSPFVARGSTYSKLLDHTSILRAVSAVVAPKRSPVYSDVVAARKVGSVLDAITLTQPRTDRPACPPAPQDVGGTIAYDPTTSGAKAFTAVLKYAKAIA